MSGPNTPLPSPRLGQAEAAALRFQRIAAIFDEARQLAPDEREAALLRACADDGELLVEVRALLAHHEAGMDALDGSVIRPGVGARIGRYRIEGLLGEGGMGSVYRALQLEPVRRDVALKVIKLGMDTREVVRRFEAERQALARLEHPHVAKVLDGGATPDGRPYFVMELVRGTPITEFCDERRLDWRDRVRLMLDVCSAVHHAHQRGVLHRDLKPSNVLVAEVDGAMLPKIIDFGVAKALESRDGVTAMTLSTALGHVVGTPEYMSPEQAAGEAVDTRTDVFALGVVLYELLAGVTPVRARSTAGRRTPAPIELRRRLLEGDAPRVSSAIDEPRAALRRTTAVALRRALRGELDWIVLKALDRDPERRYASVAALADDLTRLLADEPIVARPPSSTYLLAKFARRHTVALVAIAAVSLSLFVGTGVSLYSLQEAQAERDSAREAEREQARLADALREELLASNVERGRKAARQGNWTEAWQLLSKAIEEDPDSPHARWAMRETAWEQGCLMTRRFDSKVRVTRFLPDGERLFAAATGESPVIIDLRTGSERRLLPGRGPDVWDVAISRDGRWALTGDMDGVLLRWDLEHGGEPIALLDSTPRVGGCVVLCDPERDVAYAGGVNGIVWEVHYAESPPRSRPLATGSRVKRLAIAPDGTLAVGDEQGGLLLLSPDRLGHRRLQPHESSIQSLAFGQAGRLVATGTTGATIVVNDTETGEVVRRIPNRFGTARDLRFGPDDRTLIVLGWWGLYEVLLSDDSVTSLVPFGAWRSDLAADRQTMALTSSDYRLLSVWNIGPDRGGVRGVLPPSAWPAVSARSTEPFVAALGEGVSFLDERGRREWLADMPGARVVKCDDRSDLVAVITLDRRLHVIDRVKRSVVYSGRARNIRFDASTLDIAAGRHVAYATTENAVRLIDLADGSSCEVLPPEPGEVLGVAVSSDGCWLGASSRSERNRVVDLSDGSIETFTSSTTGFCVDFTADNRRMVVGTWRGDVVAYDVHAKALFRLVGHSSMARDVVCHPTDPDLALSLGNDGTVRIWHLGLEREVALLQPFPPIEGDSNQLRAAGFVHGGLGIGLVGRGGELITHSIPLADRIIGQIRATPTSDGSTEE